MALEPIISDVYLDIYDHDTTPITIKTIASDRQTRFVRCFLQKQGEVYRPDPEATAYLIALRPDRSVIVGPAEMVELVPENSYTVPTSSSYEDETGEPTVSDGEITEPVESGTGNPVSEYETIVEPAIYGPKAEITKEMTEIVGTITFQFKLVQGEEELRTETFKASNGVNVENAGKCVIDLT